MPVLNQDDIQRDAEDRSAILRHLSDVQKLVSRIYPGYRVILSSEIEGHPELELKRPPFGEWTANEQIQDVLTKSGHAMHLDALLASLGSRGSKLDKDALMTRLSRGKGKHYNSLGRGVWGLPGQEIAVPNSTPNGKKDPMDNPMF